MNVMEMGEKPVKEEELRERCWSFYPERKERELLLGNQIYKSAVELLVVCDSLNQTRYEAYFVQIAYSGSGGCGGRGSLICTGQS
jgi:hypothetical protein